MNELQATAKWLTTTLTEDVGLVALVSTRTYETQAPLSATYPFVLFNFQAGTDRNAVGADSRLFTRPLYQIKGVAEGGSYASADAIAHAIDAALVGASGTVTIGSQQYQVFVVGRETPVRYVEVVAGGKRYCHSGGLYRLYTQSV